MKKFFKKIAFVSAMAMVVSAMPAQSAAAAEGPQMSKWVGFYLNSDKSGTYSNEAKYARVWDWKEDYVSVSFESSNPEVATVTAKKGKVTPLSVGTTTITATFTDADGETVARTCKVTVKKNAVEVGISDNSEASLKDLTIGDVFQTKTYRLGADGEKTWKGKTVITDGVRFASSDESVFTVTSTTGKVTAVGAGEAKLSVWAVQTEKPVVDEATGKSVYRPTTEVAKYDVVVKSAGILSVEQTELDKIVLTTDCEDAAASIKAEDLKIEYILGTNPIADFIKSVEVDSNDKKNVVVTLHNPIVKDQKYVVTYGEQTFEFTGADDVVAGIEIVTATACVGDAADIEVAMFNKDGVKIGTVKVSEAAELSVSAPESLEGDYFLDPLGSIWFFNADKKAVVTVSYDNGFDDYGNEIKDFNATKEITSYSIAAATKGNVEGWALGAAVPEDITKLAYTTGALSVAVGDSTYYLYGKYKHSYNGTDTTVYTNDSSYDTFTFQSTNENVLLVYDNQLLPVAKGGASVIVKNSAGVVVGVANVIVEASRYLDKIDVTVDNTKLSTGKQGATATIKAYDQLGTPITVPASAITVTQTNAATVGSLVTATPGENSVAFESTNATNTVKNAFVKIVVKIGDVEKPYTTVLSTKTAEDTVSYKLNITKNAIDTKLNKTGCTLTDYQSLITVDEYDKDLFKSGAVVPAAVQDTVPEKSAESGFYIVVTRGDADLDAYLKADGTFSAVVADGNVLTKAPGGVYTVRVYKVTKNTSVQVISANSIVVSDSTVALTVTQDEKTIATNTAAAIDGVVSFKRGNDAVANVEVTDFVLSNIDNDAAMFVTNLEVTETLDDGKTFVWTVALNKLFSVTEFQSED